MSDVLERARSGDVGGRVEALRELGHLDTAAAKALNGLAEALSESITDDEPKVRCAALDSIGRLAHEGSRSLVAETRRAVIDCTTHPSNGVRAEAAVALVLLDEPATDETVRILSRLLDDPSVAVRRESAAALGDCGLAQAATHLRRHLDDEDGGTRFEVAFALANLQDASGVDILVAALTTARRRLDACEGLRRLKDPVALPALEQISKKFFLGWPERLTLWATMYTLGKAAAADAIIERTRGWNRAERLLAVGLIGNHRIAEGLTTLDTLARGDDTDLAGAAARALGDLGHPDGTVTLMDIIALEQTHADVRSDAERALAKLESTR